MFFSYTQFPRQLPAEEYNKDLSKVVYTAISAGELKAAEEKGIGQCHPVPCVGRFAFEEGTVFAANVSSMLINRCSLLV